MESAAEALAAQAHCHRMAVAQSLLDLVASAQVVAKCNSTSDGSCDGKDSSSLTEDTASVTEDTVAHPDDPVKLRKRQRAEYAREYYRRRHPFRPVFGGDFRRDLALMWINTLNTGNPFMLRTFLYTFSKVQECVHSNIFPTHMLRVLPMLHTVGAANQSVLQGAFLALTVPDLVVQMMSCRVVQTVNEPGSKLVMRVRYAGTVLFKVPADTQAQLVRTVLGRNHDECAVDSAASTHSDGNGEGDDALQSLVPTLRPLCVAVARPVSVCVEGTYVFTLDAQHAICTRELNFDRLLATPADLPAPPTTTTTTVGAACNTATAPSSTASAVATATVAALVSLTNPSPGPQP